MPIGVPPEPPVPTVGVTELDAVDSWLIPDLLIAVTLNVYEVLPVNPVTLMGLAIPEPVIP